MRASVSVCVYVSVFACVLACVREHTRVFVFVTTYIIKQRELGYGFRHARVI